MAKPGPKKPHPTQYKPGQSGNPATQFKPGVSGNPSGRPKRLPITDRYRDRLEEKLPDDDVHNDLRKKLRLPKNATYGDLAVAMQMREATKGKTQAIQEIREAVEGKALQRVRMEDDEGNAIDLGLGAAELRASIAQLAEQIRKNRNGQK
jgi:Family of unknown function (DUF5681)